MTGLERLKRKPYGIDQKEKHLASSASASKSIDHWRLFIAIEVPAQLREALAAYIKELRAGVASVHASWSREDNLHLTLKFLGDTPVPKIETLSQAIHQAASEFQPFELNVSGCGAFPANGQPRVLWVGISDQSGTLARLHEAIEIECAKVNFARETRPFHPHLTVARFRTPHGSRELGSLHRLKDFARQSFHVSRVTLFRSELMSEGSRHTAIARHSLIGSL